MRKYLYLLKVNLSQIGSYRADLLFSWLTRVFQMAVVFILWSITQKTESEINRLFTYYILFFLFFDLVATGRITRIISREIRRGDLSGFLLKPINYIVGVWIKVLGFITARLIIPLGIVLILALIRPDILAPTSTINFLLFLASSFLFLFLWNFFVTIIGCISFWVNEVMQLLNVINLLLNIIIGRYIPLYLFPQNVQDIISLTPANYFGNFQISLYQGSLPNETIVRGFIVMIFWIITFAILTNILYKKGVRIYEASGN